MTSVRLHFNVCTLPTVYGNIVCMHSSLSFMHYDVQYMFSASYKCMHVRVCDEVWMDANPTGSLSDRTKLSSGVQQVMLS